MSIGDHKPPATNQDALSILKQYWHYDAFRPMQGEIIRSVLEGRDTLALLPTGAGKSLCYQVPAMAWPGLVLVVSPLIALMKDQVDQLRRRNITAFALYSGMSRKEVINTLQVASRSNCKFLYVSPERLETALFSEYLLSLPVSLIAVDEAHCVSQWGYDFRPPYLRIAALRQVLPEVPMLALTASATPEVLEDIGGRLELRTPAVFRQAFTRPALSYSVFNVENMAVKVTEILQKVPGSSIVYCKTRKATREISDALNRQGIPAGAYHAGLPQEERSQRQEAWLKDRLRVIVSTNAFGMGIDKSEVRTVIHAGVPESVENYYQEAGRAGRDGKKAYAVLLCRPSETAQLEEMPESRYPALEKIRPVYQALMNYLQLPAGSGEGNYYDFDLTRFVDMFGGAGSRRPEDGKGPGARLQGGMGGRRSEDVRQAGDEGKAGEALPRLDMSTVLNVISALEQEGLMSLQQQVFLPARLRFITAKDALYEFERDHAALEPLIHALLRTYEGIFDQPVPVREKQLAYLTRKDVAQVTEELRQLQAFHIIDYTPPKDTPQLYFIHNRVRAEDLYIDPIRYRQRKEQYALRIRAMIRYLGLAGECRSRYLAHYFGDKAAEDCGICDNCLRNARRDASSGMQGEMRDR